MMRTVIGGSLLLFALTLGWSIVTGRAPQVREQEVTYRPIQVVEDGYVSSTACRACHPAQYDAWHGSFHRTMTQVATPESVRADFDNVRVDAVAGNPIALERRGTEYWAEFGDPEWRGPGDGRPRISRQIVMITGSHYQQVYWYRTDRGRVLGQLPAMFLIGEGRWIPRDAALLHPRVEGAPPETGRWNAVCVNCHATNGKRRFDAPADVVAAGVDAIAADTRVAELGIACEACHGPAAEHVRQNGSPLRRYAQYLKGEANSAIVQPARLGSALSSQVCGQCHAVWEHFDQAAERQANVRGMLYRPGDDLSATRFVIQPTRNSNAPTMKGILQSYPGYLADSFWPDGMVRVSGREYNGLIDSPCFANATEGNRTLTCFSCHTMHKAADDPRAVAEWADTHQVGAGKEGNGACLQCHATTVGSNVQAHTNHRADSTGSSCYNCHMPFTTYGLLRAMRSHQISSPSVAASVETGRPNACNSCHLDKTLAWTSEHLGRWYGMPPVPLSEDQQTVAASLLWLLRGDAGQRALAAWSMGWQPAQAASGTDWMAVPLAMLLNDPYDAVRFVTSRSLRSLPGFPGFEYDFLAPPPERTAATLRALDLSARLLPAPARRRDAALLLDGNGAPRMDAIVRLGLQRDDRPVVLRE